MEGTSRTDSLGAWLRPHRAKQNASWYLFFSLRNKIDTHRTQHRET